MRSSPHIFRKEFHMAEVDKETFDVSREALGIEPNADKPNDVDKVVQGEVVRWRFSRCGIICRQRRHDSKRQGHAIRYRIPGIQSFAVR